MNKSEQEISAIETAAVMVKLKNGNVHQVALQDEQIKILLDKLQLMFNFDKYNHSIQLLETPLEIDIINVENSKPKK